MCTHLCIQSLRRIFDYFLLDRYTTLFFCFHYHHYLSLTHIHKEPILAKMLVLKGIFYKARVMFIACRFRSVLWD